jgi:hypothetical protein
MNYAEMSLIELKQIAKQRRYIKRYYVKSKEELVAILSLPAPPPEMLLEKKTIRDLREEAKQRGMKGRGVWDMRRDDLLALLYPPNPLEKTPADKNQQDESNTYEHNDPQEHYAE